MIKIDADTFSVNLINWLIVCEEPLMIPKLFA